VNRAKLPNESCWNKCVPCGSGDEPLKINRNPLLAGGAENCLLGTAKLAWFTGTMAGKSSTAASVIQTGWSLPATVTLKFVPIALEKLLRPR